MTVSAHPLTEWSARLCVACYLASLAWSLRQRERSTSALWLWTLAAILLGLHVLLAFHFEHGWSHAAALAHTANRTAAVTGFQSGIGLYVNYATFALWLTDVGLQWMPCGYDRLRSIVHVATHCVCGFIVFNATVVFGPRWWSWTAIAFGAVLACQWWHRPAVLQSSPGVQQRPRD